MWIHQKPIIQISFMTPTENSSVITNGAQVPWEYPRHLKDLYGHFFMQGIALKIPQYLYLLMEKSIQFLTNVRFVLLTIK